MAPVEKQAALEEPDRAVVLEQGRLDQPGTLEECKALDPPPTEKELLFQVWWNFRLKTCQCVTGTGPRDQELRGRIPLGGPTHYCFIHPCASACGCEESNHHRLWGEAYHLRPKMDVVTSSARLC